MQDRVPQARLYKVWNVPQWASPDATWLQIAASVLSDGKSSRLYKRLVYDDQIATDVNAVMAGQEIAGQFVVTASARAGVDLAKVERAVNEEIARFLAGGPTPAELARVRARARAGFIRGIERIGGFGGKSDVLAQGEVFAGRADFYKVRLQRIATATAAQVRSAASRWLSDGDYTLEVHPFPDYASAPSGVERSTLPVAGPPPAPSFPKLERDTLTNGLRIVLAERRSIPQVRFDLLLDAGYASDQFAEPGTASLAMSMLDEGTRTRTAIQISDRLAELGANLGASSRLDVSSVSLEALRDRLDPSLEVFADVVLHPVFRQFDVDRLKKQRLAQIQREKADPVGLALRVFPGLVFGEGHAYANPWSGSGTEASTRSITRADLVKFHETWFKPNHATLVVVGDIAMRELRPRLEKLFASWKPGDVPQKNIGAVAQRPRPTVYLFDRPGAEQSVIIAGNIAPPKSNPEEPAIETMSAVLGSDFGSRLNMNLREDKHWAYGAYSFIRDARGQRPFLVYAPVQTDKTKEAAAELLKELRGIVGDRPIQPDELERAKASLTLTLPGVWETMDAVAGSVDDIVAFGLDDDYFDTYAGKIRSQSLSTVTAAARSTVQPDHMVWIFVGDRAKIEAPIRQLGLGEVQALDADGKPVPTS
jgi:zinc protease